MKIIATLIKDSCNSGRYPVRICVTHRRKRAYRSIDISVKDSEWDTSKRLVRSTHPNAVLLNRRIRRELALAESDLSRELLTGTGEITINKIRAILKGKVNSSSVQDFITGLIESKRSKYSPETIDNWQQELRRLIHYGGADLCFSDIDPAFLRKYEQWLRDQGGVSGGMKPDYIYGKPLSDNSVHKTWKHLKKFFKAAISEKITTDYPFTSYGDNPVYRQTDRTFLYPDEVDQIESLLSQPLHDTVRTVLMYFLLGCYSGLRVSDWQRFSPAFIQQEGTRLLLRAKKNGQQVSMKMPPKLKEITTKLLSLPPCPNEQECNETLKVIAAMAGITKNLTTHVGRHTFAVGCAIRGISKEATAELMGITVKTVSVYYKVVNSVLDDEMGKWG